MYLPLIPFTVAAEFKSAILSKYFPIFVNLSNVGRWSVPYFSQPATDAEENKRNTALSPQLSRDQFSENTQAYMDV